VNNSNNCSKYEGGKSTPAKHNIKPDDVITVRVKYSESILHISTKEWTENIILPSGRTWYPHFNNYNAIFELKR